MHKIAIPSYAIERALARRGRLHPFEDLDPARTALVVVDLQNGFMVPGQPAEIAQAREIVPAVNRLARATRAAGGNGGERSAADSARYGRSGRVANFYGHLLAQSRQRSLDLFRL